MTEIKFSDYWTHMNMPNWAKKFPQALKSYTKYNMQLRKSGKEMLAFSEKSAPILSSTNSSALKSFMQVALGLFKLYL